jgi:hypothetical protein
MEEVSADLYDVWTIQLALISLVSRLLELTIVTTVLLA